ncbi:hypothetical protein PENTCL1PPCAC_22992, partial [Pristionchus entomophagus]
SGEDPRSYRRGHCLFDHSFYPDIAILRVRGQNFIVSSSYLALHSPFFYNLFYGSSSNGRFDLDVDPGPFGDLLDMIYPCLKKTNCCVVFSSSIMDRLNLALQLKLRLAVKILIMDNSQQLCVLRDFAKILHQNNAWESYSHLFDSDSIYPFDEMKRDMSDSLDPLYVCTSFPDSTTVLVRGMSILVSATALSLHSSVLGKMLYNKGQVVRGVKIDADPLSFVTFLQTTIGDFPLECRSKFLDDLVTLGAKHSYEYYLSMIKKKMTILSREEAIHCGKNLLEHYSRQPTLDTINMRYIARYLTINELEKVLSICSSLSRSVKEELRSYVDTANAINLFVKTCSGKTINFVLSKGVQTTLFEVKMKVEERERIPADQQRYIYHGKQLEDDAHRTLQSYNAGNGSTLHLLLKWPHRLPIHPSHLINSS